MILALTLTFSSSPHTASNNTADQKVSSIIPSTRNSLPFRKLIPFNLHLTLTNITETHMRQVWFADDATAGGSLNGLREWWSRLQSQGPSYIIMGTL